MKKNLLLTSSAIVLAFLNIVTFGGNACSQIQTKTSNSNFSTIHEIKKTNNPTSQSDNRTNHHSSIKHTQPTCVKMPNDVSTSALNKLAVLSKCTAVDDKGRAYTTGLEGDSIKIFDATISHAIYSIPMEKCEGIAVRRESGKLFLYATEKITGTLSRFILSESQDMVTGHALSGFDGSGKISIFKGEGISQVKFSPDGKILVINPESGVVSRINTDGIEEGFCHIAKALNE